VVETAEVTYWGLCPDCRTQGLAEASPAGASTF
jgi:hypothetical protein